VLKPREATLNHRVSATVIHASFRPERRALATRCLDSLAGGPQVNLQVESVERGPWPAFRDALTKIEVGADAHVVVQDDAIAVPGFWQAVDNILSALPGVPVCLYNAKKVLAEEAISQGKDWLRFDGDWTCVAGIYSVPLVWDFLTWEQQNVPESYLHDDGRWSIFCYLHGVVTWFPVRSLLEHDDGGISILGHHGGGRRAGILEDRAAERDYSRIEACTRVYKTSFGNPSQRVLTLITGQLSSGNLE
jgi:hypothetical protein